MPQHSEQILQQFVVELARLRALDSAQLAHELGAMTPLWTPVRIVHTAQSELQTGVLGGKIRTEAPA